jgi:hypothetical protein
LRMRRAYLDERAEHGILNEAIELVLGLLVVAAVFLINRHQ